MLRPLGRNLVDGIFLANESVSYCRRAAVFAQSAATAVQLDFDHWLQFLSERKVTEKF